MACRSGTALASPAWIRPSPRAALSDTGRVFDLALEGGGFFALESSEGRSFTRVGTFGLDSQQNLVDQGSGMRVLNPSGAAISLDVASLFPPQVTTDVTMKGNLSAVVEGPLAELLSANSSFSMGTAAEIASTGTSATYNVSSVGGAPGDIVAMELIANGGVPQQVIVSSDPTTGDVTSASIARSHQRAAGCDGHRERGRADRDLDEPQGRLVLC